MASEPFNIKKIAPKEKIEILTLDDELPQFDIVDYETDEEAKFINDIEKFVRGTFEYQEEIQYIRKYMDMNQCSFYENISNIDTNCIKIHLHHSPITLMEIVVTVLEKRRFYRESTLIESIALEVMYIHYITAIGLIPLCETVHELVHNQFLFVPNTAVFGNYEWFEETYGPWIPTQVRNKLDHIKEWTKFYNQEENKNVLRQHYIYLDMGDKKLGVNLPKLQDVKALLETRMEEIRNNNFQTGPIQLVTMDPKYIIQPTS